MANLWKCPKCGIVGRLAHRYRAPHPKGDGVGECSTGATLEAGLAMQHRRETFIAALSRAMESNND